MDLRLLVPAVVVWAVTAFGLVAPVGVSVSIAIVASVAAVAGVVGSRRFGWGVVGLVVVGAGLAAACATSLALRQEVRADHPLGHVAGKATAVMTLRSDPTPIGPAGQGRIRARVDVEQIGNQRVTNAAAELRGAAQSWLGLLPGQRVVAVVKVRAPPNRSLLVASVTASTPKLVGEPPAYQRVAGSIRQRLQLVATRGLEPEAAGLLPGLVLGDESGLDEDLRDDFRAAGLSHLTAVSGHTVEKGYTSLVRSKEGIRGRASTSAGTTNAVRLSNRALLGGQ